MRMIDVVTTVLKSPRGRGDTRAAKYPILTDCTSMVHMLRILMESTGAVL